MRHNKKFNHLSRKKGHRDALLANLTISLIEHKRIFTTLAKAKALRVYCEPIITRCKKDDMLNRRVVFSYLQNKEAVKELFGVIADKVANRPGGYLRIIKTGNRLGDNAEMAMIEFVDFNEAALASAEPKKATRRTRRSKKSAPKAEAPAVEAAEANEATEAPAAE
ncbi:MAG: 50S ribosomal protein L17 [Muribaculaceae bacterium]|nr:50S ribosomal protein L17 [Muribaculaceae bacterium]MDD6701717.1 50S ribosomal protein L17 [Bacteroidales bacterium]MDD6943343.1 50S ribosomal protein L17 [Bacteroidales bacterium]MDY2733162.1 50S ribosomal protein L17 [Muribaculaceae bacterium]